MPWPSVELLFQSLGTAILGTFPEEKTPPSQGQAKDPSNPPFRRFYALKLGSDGDPDLRTFGVSDVNSVSSWRLADADGSDGMDGMDGMDGNLGERLFVAHLKSLIFRGIGAIAACRLGLGPKCGSVHSGLRL